MKKTKQTILLLAAAYEIITPSLYDVVAQSKNVRDADSAEMVDIIINGRTYDFNTINLLAKKSNTIVSTMEKTRSKAEKAMMKLVSKYQSIE